MACSQTCGTETVVGLEPRSPGAYVRGFLVLQGLVLVERGQGKVQEGPPCALCQALHAEVGVEAVTPVCPWQRQLSALTRAPSCSSGTLATTQTTLCTSAGAGPCCSPRLPR